MKKKVYYKCIGLKGRIIIWNKYFTIGKSYKQSFITDSKISLMLIGNGGDNSGAWAVDIDQFELVK